MDVLLHIYCLGIMFFNTTVGLENLAQNLEYRGNASQSTLHVKWAAADKAIDGHLEEEAGQDFCSITRSTKFTEAWWKLPLKQRSNVAYLQIFFRNSRCSSQQFGENCSKCSTKCLNQECDAYNGSCIYGCNQKFVEPPHCAVCKAGYYGQNCEYICGQCKTGTYCHNVTGICNEGCQDHWKAPLCNVCKAGYYGQNCEYICGQCKTGTYCHNVTGICYEGCQDNWNGSLCNVCKNGHYGRNCEHMCGMCSLVVSCNKFSGICEDGCKDRWNGSKCNICADGFHGFNCESKCGECISGTICDPSTGVCPEGCRCNWTGPKCDEITIKRESMIICTDDGISKTSAVFISIFSTLLSVFLMHAGIQIVNKRKNGRDQSNNMAAKAVDNSKFYDQITDTKNDHTYQKISNSPKKPDHQETHSYDNIKYTQSK